MGFSRRRFLFGLGAAVGAGALASAGAALARSGRRRIVRTATATHTGEYLYLPFRDPDGVNEVSVKLTASSPTGSRSGPDPSSRMTRRRSRSGTRGTKNAGGFAPGHPTNVVYAEALSKEGVVGALKKGRLFITRAPDGAELYLSATGPGGQRRVVGGTVYGGEAGTATFSVTVRGGAGKLLILPRDGTPVLASPITSDGETVALDHAVGAGGYVRAELRDEPAFEVPNVPASRGPMEALTDPIFLVRDPEPAENESVDAPPNTREEQ